MKKILFVIRDGYDANYIISELKKKLTTYKVIYVLESGKKAKRAKFMRMIKRDGFSSLVNMAALVVYDKIMIKGMIKRLNKPVKPRDLLYRYIDDVNDVELFRLCQEFSPDVMLIYGSSILKKSTINSLNVDIFNIHSSILPYYRNVHSDFWAYKSNDYSKIGITIFKLDSGIDSGDIALQYVASPQSSLPDYKAENLRGIIKLVPNFLDKYFDNNITLCRQEEKYATKSVTPSTRDIITFLRSQK